MHLCDQSKWPFYSVLIYAIARLTHFSYLNSAFLLNGFFTLISVLTFINLVNQLSKNQRVVWLAAAVILLAQEFNAVRTDIVRDHGFWAFYLLSVLFLLKYFRQSELNFFSWPFSFGWAICLIVATLFRVEGVIFLILMPFAVFFMAESD